MAYRRSRAADEPRRHRAQRLRTLGLLCLLLVLLPATVRGTLAYMQANSRVENTFTVAALSLDIAEDFDGGTKENVTVRNTGDAPAYLRGAVSVFWRGTDGSILPDVPALGTDYSITLGSGWIQGADGFWYCSAPVAAGGTSPALIETCSLLNTVAGQTLCVTIDVQGVQASPAAAAEELWGVSIGADGALTPKGGTAP